MRAKAVRHLTDEQGDGPCRSPVKTSKYIEDALPEKEVAQWQFITELLPSSPSFGPTSPLGARKSKATVESRMDDGVLHHISTLLASGCSIQLACNEVGLARTTFYRWLDRIRSLQSDESRWASVSESYRMFAEATTSCLIKKETEGSGHVISCPIKLHAAADSCGSVSPPFAAGDSKSEEANSLPGVTCTSFANLPNRLRRHFLHMMHKSVKAKFGRHKSWAGMSREEKAELQQMSEDVLKYPTNVSAPLEFMWDGATVTKHFTNYDFLRPISLQLMIRYLRDRCYRSVRPQGEPLSNRRDIECAEFEPEPTNSNGSCSDNSEILSLEHDDLELDLTSGATAKRLGILEDYRLQRFDVDRHIPRRTSVQDIRSMFADEDFRITSTADHAPHYSTDFVDGDHVKSYFSNGTAAMDKLSFLSSKTSPSLVDHDVTLDGAETCRCDAVVAAYQANPIMDGLFELSALISGNVMVVHHGRGNSVQWLLSHTAVSSICALDWCPLVNASIITPSFAPNSSVTITVPGHGMLPKELGNGRAYNAVIDTNVAVYNLEYAPLFPERDRELSELEMHLRSMCNILGADGTAILLCRSTDILSSVILILQSLSLEIVRIVRCFGKSLMASLKTEDVWLVARKK